MSKKTVMSELDLLRQRANVQYEEEHHTTHIFPANTGLDVVLTCGLVPNTWSAWTELQDSGATTLSSLIGMGIDIGAVIVEEVSDTNEKYMLELAYGTPKVSISPVRFVSGAQAKLPAIQDMRVRTSRIPAGETIYYRAMGETGGATFNIHIRYFHHS